MYCDVYRRPFQSVRLCLLHTIPHNYWLSLSILGNEKKYCKNQKNKNYNKIKKKHLKKLLLKNIKSSFKHNFSRAFKILSLGLVHILDPAYKTVKLPKAC